MDGGCSGACALALVHSDACAPLDVRDWEAHHLADPQACGIGSSHQQGAVLGMPGSGKEALEFLGTEHAGEPLAIGPGWQVELGHGPAEGLHIEEADRRGGDITYSRLTGVRPAGDGDRRESRQTLVDPGSSHNDD